MLKVILTSLALSSSKTLFGPDRVNHYHLKWREGTLEFSFNMSKLRNFWEALMTYPYYTWPKYYTLTQVSQCGREEIIQSNLKLK